MFRAAMCPSSGELIVLIQHLLYVTLYGCPKHVENRNKHINRKTVRHVGYLQRLYRNAARSTGHKIWTFCVLLFFYVGRQFFPHIYRSKQCLYFCIDLSCFVSNIYLTPHIKTLKYFFLCVWRCGPTRVMASSFLRFLDHTQRRATIDWTSLDEWSARRRDLHLTTHSTSNRQSSALGGTQTVTNTGLPKIYCVIIANCITWVQVVAHQLSLLTTRELPIAHQVQH
jgi:hypothetical protein